jgi:hypothetical protein
MSRTERKTTTPRRHSLHPFPSKVPRMLSQTLHRLASSFPSSPGQFFERVQEFNSHARLFALCLLEMTETRACVEMLNSLATLPPSRIRQELIEHTLAHINCFIADLSSISYNAAHTDSDTEEEEEAGPEEETEEEEHRGPTDCPRPAAAAA